MCLITAPIRDNKINVSACWTAFLQYFFFLLTLSYTMSNGEDSEHLDDPDFLSNYVSGFTPRDARSLRVTFRSATNANEVIPHLMPNNRGICDNVSPSKL